MTIRSWARIRSKVLVTTWLFCSRVDVNIAAKLNFKQCESGMYKARRAMNPPIPETIDMYAEDIIKYHQRYGQVNGKPFYSATVGKEGERSIIFMNQDLNNLMLDCQELHVDGTFKILPRKPNCRQLMTIMAVAHDHVSN